MTLPRCFIGLILILPLALSAQHSDSIHSVLDTAKNQYRVKALNEMFRAYLPSDPVKALGYAREALSYGTEIADKKGTAAAYNNLGVAYRMNGALDKALGYYINALRLYEELGNKEGIASSKNNIATLYSVKKDYDQARRYLEESNTIFNELNDEEKIIGSLNNLGNLYAEMQMYEKALQYYTDAYTRSEKAGKDSGDPLTNIGNLHFKQKNYAGAVSYYLKAQEHERKFNDKNGLLNVLTNLGVAYTKQKDTRKAAAVLNEALELCNETQAYSYLPAIYKAQGENFYNQGDYKQAYEAEIRYDEARELIFGEESTRNIAQMELQLSFTEKEKELDMLKKDDEIKTLELKNTRMIVIMIIVGGLVVIGALNYIFLSKKKIIKKRMA